MFDAKAIDHSRGRKVRFVGREYETSGSERTYRVPDARVGESAFDVTLTRKTLGTPQVRGFLSTDFKPRVVVIIRQPQMGANSSYAMIKPGT